MQIVYNFLDRGKRVFGAIYSESGILSRENSPENIMELEFHYNFKTAPSHIMRFEFNKACKEVLTLRGVASGKYHVSIFL